MKKFSDKGLRDVLLKQIVTGTITISLLCISVTFTGFFLTQNKWLQSLIKNDFQNAPLEKTAESIESSEKTADGTQGLMYSFDWSNRTAVVSGYKGTDTEVIVPSNYKGCDVVGVSIVLLEDNDIIINKLCLPESISEISEVSLKNFNSDLTIECEGAVDSFLIENYEGQSLTLPPYTRSLRLWKGSNLKTLCLPDSVRRLEISECPMLVDFLVPENLSELSIGGCNLLTELNLPDSLNNLSIGGVSITSLNLGKNLTHLTIYSDTLTTLTGGENLYTAYLSGVKIKDISMMPNVKNLTLSECDCIEELIVPDSIEHLTIKRCNNLKSLTLSTGLSQLGLSKCKRINELLIPDDASFNVNEKIFPYELPLVKKNEYEGMIYIGSQNNPYFMLIDSGTAVGDVCVHDDTVIIASETFFQSEDITSVSIKDGVKYDDKCFYECKPVVVVRK